ncbi:MAG: hypothetical protein WC763_01640 [Candidatus Paceibacterota bacterium]|jgi:hypothetical protein
MNDFDSKKLDGLLESGNLAEAGALIKSAFAGSDGKGARADVAIDSVLAYVKLSNAANRRYLESLQSTEDLLRKTGSTEGKVSDMVKIAGIKSGLRAA